jgi:hypothetical protein
MIYRDRLRGHLADGDPGQPGPARRPLTRALVRRGQPALGPFDLTLGEDSSQIRTRNAPRVTACATWPSPSCA